VNRRAENDILQVISIAKQYSYIRYISESH